MKVIICFSCFSTVDETIFVSITIGYVTPQEPVLPNPSGLHEELFPELRSHSVLSIPKLWDVVIEVPHILTTCFTGHASLPTFMSSE